VPPVSAALAQIVGGGSQRGPRTHVSLAVVFVLAIAISQLADIRVWLRPRSPAADIARVIARDGRPGDLILIMPAPQASSFNFYYNGTLEQWAPPFSTRVTNMPWAGLLERLQDPQVHAGFIDALTNRLQAGRRVWVISGGAGTLSLEPSIEAESPRQSTPYARALRATREDLLRVLYRHAQRNPMSIAPALDYWEPTEAALFEPIRHAAVPEVQPTSR
jgi:hypothetical protein